MKRPIILFLLPVCALALNKTQRVFSPILRPIQSEIRTAYTIPNPIRICALRVAFQLDVNPATTGDGQFLMTASLPCDDFPIVDPAPHNNTYFKDHIKALANFYRHASRGKVVIDTVQSAVFPLDKSTVYQLPRKMEYYHPFLEEDSVDIRLTELFVQAVHLAEADPDVDFTQYDIVVVFHAGVGQDFELFLDPTPYDIPSAYLNPGDLTNYYAVVGLPPDYLPVDRGIILPESQNHLFYPNWEDVFGGAEIPCDYQIGLNGTFALMMGYFLGLPGLYDTENGATGVGKFGLMDQGSANLNGLVPAYPSAWEREFMGWDMPVFANGYQNVKLPYVESGADTTLWRIPINDDEYFLVENRYNHIHPGVYLDSMQYKIYVDNGERDWPALIPLIFDSIGAEFSAAGVLLDVPRYDVGLPGSGLLIWHIDESVIDANIAQNRVNADRTHRGVDLEEGDGAQDLGYESQLIGANVDNGWYFDPWFAGNKGFWHLNPDYPQDDLKRVGFTDYTNPSARSYNGAFTGIAVDSIGPADSVMSFRIKDSYFLEGFKINEGIDSTETTSDLRVFPVNFDSTDQYNELVVTGKVQFVSYYYVFDESGTKIPSVFSHQNELTLHFTLSYLSGNYYLVKIARNLMRRGIDYTLFIYSIDENGILNLAGSQVIPGTRLISNICAFQNELFFCMLDEASNNYFLIKYLPTSNAVESQNLDFPIYQFVSDGTVLIGDTRAGSILQIDPTTLATGVLFSDLKTGSAVIGLAYLDENDQVDLVVNYPDQLHLIRDFLSTALVSYYYNGQFDSMLAFGDIDGDGRVEVLAKNDHEIFAFNEALVMEGNFPIRVPNQYAGKSFVPHLLTSDVDGDQILDIIVTLEDVGILAYNYRGRLIAGYPRALPNSRSDQSVLMENGRGTFLLTANQNGNQLIGLYLTDQPLSPDSWYCSGGHPCQSYFYSKKSQSSVITGGGLLNKKKTFNWPNPTKNDQTAIRYYPNSDCNIEINIYDLAGDFITSFKDSHPLVGDYNEITWNVGGIANGVYFAVVKATSGTKTESKIIKIMVIH
jgi:hypothetical protein